MQYNILIVTSSLDAELEYIELFESAGIKCHRLANGDNVAAWVKRHNPNMVLLEIIPLITSYMTANDAEIDTIHYCNEIRRFSTIPILVASASELQIKRMTILDIAVSLYLDSNYKAEDLVIQSLAAISKSEIKSKRLEALVLELDATGNSIHFGDVELRLSPLEFELFQLFYTDPNKTYTREQIWQAIFPNDEIANTRTIDNHVKNLRGKLKVLDAENNMILSIYGVGYKFNSELL